MRHAGQVTQGRITEIRCTAWKKVLVGLQNLDQLYTPGGDVGGLLLRLLLQGGQGDGGMLQVAATLLQLLLHRVMLANKAQVTSFQGCMLGSQVFFLAQGTLQLRLKR